jgi:NAD-dependent dihydropyrimidine dehydrogenase PreA subunit
VVGELRHRARNKGAIVNPADLPAYLRDTALRLLPHRAPTGLVRVGRPGRGAPVLVTGNFTLTVRRLCDALRGHDVWLLVANSKGINVWCAAGGGYFTHHDIIAAIRISRLADEVDHREVILPQLCATGVERRRITEATGFRTRWGPARLEDLPAFLDRGARVRKSERFMRFPLWERLEMAAMWSVPMLLIALPILALVFGLASALVAGGAVALLVFGLFGMLPGIEVQGRVRFLTFAGFVAAAALAGSATLFVLGGVAPAPLAAVAGSCLAAMALLSIDLAGTTPWYPSSINTFRNEARIELVADRCTGAAECVQVCPRDVLKMNGRRRKVEIHKPDQCIQCGACIVQCPHDALRFRYDDGRVAEAPIIRRTRLNMLGRRSVELSD